MKQDLFNINNVTEEVENDFFDMGFDGLKTSNEPEEDDFFKEFNQPSKKIEIQKEELQKINTYLPVELHKKLKIYCTNNDLTKNEAFTKCLQDIIEKRLPMIMENSKVTKKAYNFEIPKDLHKKVKLYCAEEDVKLNILYESGISHYLSINSIKSI